MGHERCKQIHDEDGLQNQCSLVVIRIRRTVSRDDEDSEKKSETEANNHTGGVGDQQRGQGSDGVRLHQRALCVEVMRGGEQGIISKDHKFARVSRYGVKVEKHERTTEMWLLMIVFVGFCVYV